MKKLLRSVFAFSVISAGAMIVSPSPGNGKLFIGGGFTELIGITIYDELGQQVQHVQTAMSGTEIDLSGFGKGLYNMVYRQGGQTRSVKIITN